MPRPERRDHQRHEEEMRFYSVRFGCLLAVACFLSLSWIKSSPSHGVHLDLRSFYERLLVAEQLGDQVRKDLGSILEELRNISKAANNTYHSTSNANSSKNHDNDKNNKNNKNNSSKTPIETERPTFPGLDGPTILQPSIYIYMPHLRHHPESLTPNIVLGQGRRGVSVVIGVPTVKREKQSYLVSTLSSLLFSLTPDQRKDILIIVFIAETDSDYISSAAQTISSNFPKEVQSGLLEVVSPSQFYYPDFSGLSETFGDAKDRVKWRTKQNLDFSFLMFYAQDKGTYYVQLEDDVVAAADYFSTMKSFADQEASKGWLYLEFSTLGFIGKLFRTRDLPMIAEFFLMFHRDKPIDWLLDHILWVRVCNPEKDSTDCQKKKEALKQRYKPSLFQHIGLHSSLSGKIQRLKDKDFGGQILFQGHSNPPAVLSSSLNQYQQHSLERAYRGQDFFWATTPVRHDYILFNFSQPIRISGWRYYTVTKDNRIQVYSNQKPWMTGEVRTLLRNRNIAFRSCDMELYSVARADLKRGIRRAKQDYKNKTEDHLHSTTRGGCGRGSRIS
ncbi:alpha-1,3-mannosyl-glycoprotein 4-beta-N-acetylglucosaminyltransferase A-like [Cheilinus undulatus]|uniref:alpha-1,3-mannosyl-glycoprotein 4-beta-N-acetylglucosaminyltransferase A-like n=1 Tax=Cheilinus undulatus TaxID=241271 RepID=UPI001BD24F7D|nr:alpha-1,3-mannosyl-glycoprotein 4-beta-N-acetylglucosaminyltransferase A-like [Cheilinus undulatus]